MKILWFTNILLPAIRKKNGLPPTYGGGWMETLRSNLEKFYPDISLHIASFSKTFFESYTQGNATYYPIIRSASVNRMQRFLQNWKHSRYSSLALKQCVDLVDVCKPDLIHIHGTENIFGLVQEEVNVPTIVSLQGLILSIQNYSLPGLNVTDKLRYILTFDLIKGTGPVHNTIKEKAYAKIEERIIAKSKNFIGRTEWDKEMIKLLNPKGSYHHVEEILRKPFYKNIWEKSHLDRHIIFSIVSRNIRKGFLVLIDSIGILKKHGYPNIKLRLAGSLKSRYLRQIIDKRIEKNLIKNNVEFLGQLNANELASEFVNNSIFVHASYIDNSPNSLAEAMMVGIPCVATNVGGVPSMLEHNKEGLLCTPGDAYSIAASINKIFTNSNNAVLFSDKSRKRALDRHNVHSITHTINEIYDILSTR